VRKIPLLVTCLSAVLVLVSTMPALAAKKELKVGSDCTYPPFEFVDTDGNKTTGFSVDLITAVADKMGMSTKIENTSWDGIIPGLINGNYDCIISSMTITEERKKAVNFSDPYFEANQAIVVKKDNKDIKKASDLSGKRVSVQISTTGDDAATAIKGVKGPDRFQTTPDALLALMNGNDEASIVDEPLALYFIKQYPALKIANSDFEKEYYGIAVNKKNPTLLRDINKALKDLKASGKYDEIVQKWFGKK
jgi:polar amino acid transport system substrate-binding protein